MPRKITPKECACGCGGITRGGEFLQGHDSKVNSAIIKAVGGTTALRELVEQTLNRKLEVES